jgi:hypothetical protein
MLNEISPELVGKVNKARTIDKRPSKTPAGDKTRSIAVRKAWLKAKAGHIKEDGEGGIANHAGPATSTSDVHWSKRQPKIGPKGKLKKYGQPMLFKAVMRRKNVNEATVYYKALGKRVKAVSRTSAMGDGSDGSSESVQREHANATPKNYSGFKEHIVKADGGYRLVSKKTGKNLGTYPSRAGAERREREVQYFKHKG